MVNVDALDGAPVPTSWEDLLKPEYQGMVGYLDPASAFVGYVGAVAVNLAILAEQPAKPTLVMVHHHPFISGIDHMDRQPLLNPSAFAEVIGKHAQVERVLCGHLHRSVQARFASTLAISCPGVSHQVSLDLTRNGPSRFQLEPPGYLLHQWSKANGMITHQGFIDHYPGPFPFYDANGLID